jgi:RNA recognition motif-containing protein
MMFSTILENAHRIYSHSIKVSKYMSEEELNSYVEKARNCRIYIKKLPQEITNERLYSLFTRYGGIDKAYCVVGSKARKNLKYGYVIFENESSIQKIPQHGVSYRGQVLVWSSFINKKEKQKSQNPPP